jgi:hypothetical protein
MSHMVLYPRQTYPNERDNDGYNAHAEQTYQTDFVPPNQFQAYDDTQRQRHYYVMSVICARYLWQRDLLASSVRTSEAKL